jgi:hypothetical protein
MIASSDSLKIGAGLEEGWDVFGLEKLGLQRQYATVQLPFVSPLTVATKSL